MTYNDPGIQLRSSPIFAFLKTAPPLMLSVITGALAFKYLPALIFVSAFCAGFAFYRYIYIRRAIYLVTSEYIRITRGIFFKSIETVELFRVKDYTVTEPLLLQICKLMDLQLRTTDPENPVLWLRGIPQSDIVDILRDRVLQARHHHRIVEIN